MTRLELNRGRGSLGAFAVLILCSCTNHGAGQGSSTPNDQSEPELQLPSQPTMTTTIGISLDEIDEMLSRGYFDEARQQLEMLVVNAPEGWQSIQFEGDRVRFAAWSEEELAAFAASPARRGARVEWIAPSFSRALYFMAFISVEGGNAGEALTYIERALELEPEHPQILSEAGLIYHALGEHEAALQHFQRAMTSRPWAHPRDLARAQRGAATVLVELGRLEEAEELLNGSLQNDPGNSNALGELEYIRQLQSGEAPEEATPEEATPD